MDNRTIIVINSNGNNRLSEGVEKKRRQRACLKCRFRTAVLFAPGFGDERGTGRIRRWLVALAESSVRIAALAAIPDLPLEVGKV